MVLQVTSSVRSEWRCVKTTCSLYHNYPRQDLPCREGKHWSLVVKCGKIICHSKTKSDVLNI